MKWASVIVVAIAIGFFYLRYVMQGTVCTESYDLKGKVALVTGANTGIGKETAIGLARMGAKVIIACRDQKRGAEALVDIKRDSGNNDVELMLLDLADLASVRAFVAEYKKKSLPLHMLIANAGLGMLPNRTETKDGFELNIGVNHFGHFLLVNSLLDIVKSSSSIEFPARIVVVSSNAHYFANLDLEDVHLAKEGAYGWNVAYGNSKLANVMYATELQKLLDAAGFAKKVAVFAVHPGFVATEFARNAPAMFQPLIHFFATLLAKTNVRGAQPSICLAISPSLAKNAAGKYLDDWLVVNEPHKLALDDAARAKLWEISEKLTA